jgi:hypothetical protein
MKTTMTVPVDDHRQTTDKQYAQMDTFGGSHANSDYEMEASQGCPIMQGGNIGNIDLRNLDKASSRWLVTPTPGSVENEQGATAARSMQGVDHMIGVCSLPHWVTSCAHVAAPDIFSENKEDYWRFRRQIGLFLTANRNDFKEGELIIWFALSYMKGGVAELWANTYMDKALEENDWGMWEVFLDQLAKDFGNAKEPRKALEEMSKLYQGKKTAAEYFLCIEQLVNVAGIDINHYPHILLYIEKNVNHILIDQLYLLDVPLTNYQYYKRRIVAMDEMCQQRDSNKLTMCIPPPREPKDPNSMGVDRTTKQTNNRKCYTCNKEGHFLRVCPQKEGKQGF